MVPKLARIVFGLYRSVRGSHKIMAEIAAASAVLRIAPRLPPMEHPKDQNPV